MQVHISTVLKTFECVNQKNNTKPFFELTKLFPVNFPVKVNCKSELTWIYLKVSSIIKKLVLYYLWLNVIMHRDPL